MLCIITLFSIVLCIITLFSIVSFLLCLYCIFFCCVYFFILSGYPGLSSKLVLRLVSQKSARVHFPESGISESASEDYQAVLSTVIAS